MNQNIQIGFFGKNGYAAASIERFQIGSFQNMKKLQFNAPYAGLIQVVNGMADIAFRFARQSDDDMGDYGNGSILQ